MHFSPRPSDYELPFLSTVNNSIILRSLKCIVYNLTPVALATLVCLVSVELNWPRTVVAQRSVEGFLFEVLRDAVLLQATLSSPTAASAASADSRKDNAKATLAPPRPGVSISLPASDNNSSSSYTKRPLRRKEFHFSFLCHTMLSQSLGKGRRPAALRQG